METWQVEFRDGSSTRVENVKTVAIDEALGILSLRGGEGSQFGKDRERTLIEAPLDQLKYWKRIG